MVQATRSSIELTSKKFFKKLEIELKVTTKYFKILSVHSEVVAKLFKLDVSNLILETRICDSSHISRTSEDSLKLNLSAALDSFDDLSQSTM